jgi:hypothetical protein
MSRFLFHFFWNCNCCLVNGSIEWIINRWSFLVGCPKSRRLSGVDFQGGFNLENGSANNFLWIQLALEGKLSFATKSSAKTFFSCKIWLQMTSFLLALKTKNYDFVNKKAKLETSIFVHFKIHKKRGWLQHFQFL